MLHLYGTNDEGRLESVGPATEGALAEVDQNDAHSPSRCAANVLLLSAMLTSLSLTHSSLRLMLLTVIAELL